MNSPSLNGGDVIDVVLTGTRNTCRAAVPHMIAAGRGGSIIITSSAMGLMSYPGISNYVAAKHGVAGLMRAMAVELASERIRVNTLHPTAVDTPMVHNNATFSRFMPDLAEPTRDDVAEAFASMNLLPDPWISVDEASEAIASESMSVQLPLPHPNANSRCQQRCSPG